MLDTPQGNIALEDANYGQLHASTTNGYPYAVGPNNIGPALGLARSGVPTVIGFKVDGGIAVDAFVGQGMSAGYMYAFNWYSGELSFMPNVSTYGVAGTPGGASGGGSGKLFIANGATSNDMLAGPANAFSGELSGDITAKLGIVGEYGWSVEDHWTDNGLDGPRTGQAVIPTIDPKSGLHVTFGSLGVGVGVNAVGNGGEIRGSSSPGFNYTWNWVIADLY